MVSCVSEATLTRMRGMYRRGTRVELVRMNDPYTSLKAGDKGTVDHVDDIGTIHCTWDSGSSLGVARGEDEVIIIS